VTLSNHTPQTLGRSTVHDASVVVKGDRRGRTAEPMNRDFTELLLWGG